MLKLSQTKHVKTVNSFGEKEKEKVIAIMHEADQCVLEIHVKV